MVRLVENKREELRGRLTLWKNVVRFVGKKYEPHFDLTSKSGWLKNREDIIEIVRKLENNGGNMRELLRELFNKKIWAGDIKLLQKFLKEAPDEDIQELIKITVDVKNSSEFKEEWVNKVYELLKKHYLQQVERFRALKGNLFNLFSELYGKLHIETSPVMNACSRRFLERYYEFTKYDYAKFKEAFEELKKEYLKIVGKLSENGFPINAEIDQMFNFFDKVKVWQMYPGEGGKFLEAFYNEKRIFIGWGKVGDISIIAKGIKEGTTLEEELKQKIKNSYPEEYTSKSPNKAAKMLINFYGMNNWDKFPAGDIVVLKKGINRVVAICRITGKYEYLEKSPIESTDYNHARKVEFMWYNPEGVIVNELPKVTYTLEELNWDKFGKVLENVLDNEPEEFKEFKKITQLLERKSQIILYGPPGTGKTWLARQYVIKETGEDKPRNRGEFITFHQSYGYEEFIEGFRPVSRDGNMTYVVEDGIFKKMALRAVVEALKKHKKLFEDFANELEELSGYLKPDAKIEDYRRYHELKKELWTLLLSKEDRKSIFKDAPRFYLIIDEINRGNISKIFGELITLLENDKRIGGENEIIVTLPYSREPFGVPPNLYIIGTMNTADRSIALLDVALRRRFAFLEIEPKPEKLKDENNIEGINLEELLEKLNIKIEAIKDRDHRIGHSYFMKVKSLEKLHFVWYYEIVPLLMEYFYNDWESLAWLLGDGFIEDKLNKGNKKLQFKKPSEIEVGKQVEPNTPYGIKFYNVKDEQEKKEFIKALEWIIESVKEEQSGS